jgi:hypothetical protein
MASSGTIAQTLGSISQSGTVYQLLNAQLHDTVAAAGAPSEFAEETLVSTGFASDSLIWVLTEDLVGVIQASETIEFVNHTAPTEIYTGTESFDGSDYTTTFSPSGPKFGEELIPSTTVYLVSTGRFLESFEISVDASLTGSATITEDISPGVEYNQTLTATGILTESLIIGLDEILASSATVGEELIYNAVASETLSDTATLEGSEEFWTLASETLTGSATVEESFSFEGSTANELLTSTVQASEVLWAKDFGAIAWVMNTKSGGLSSYNNFGFNSMAFHDGVLYATSPEGLFELGADDDDGRKINSVLKSGFLDFGTEETKRMTDVFVGYTGGDLECDVETSEEAYTYQLEERVADTPRNNRLKPGRGLSSRYWRLTFRNVNGADFQIHDVAVNIARSKRRLL